MLTVPVEFDPAGKPVDILAPPFPIQRVLPANGGQMRIQIIVQTVTLQTVTGSAQCAIAMTFDSGSVELPALGIAEGLLAGSIAVPFFVSFRSAPGKNGGQLAQLVADFSTTTVAFSFEQNSRARLIAKIGLAMTNLAESAIQGLLTTQFRTKVGARPTGLDLELTPGVLSEKLLTVDALPGVVWVNSETLALSLQYAPEPSPAPFQPVPFLPAGQWAPFGLHLSNDGFQRTIRNPAVRKLALDTLSDRLRPGFVQQAYAKHGGPGGPTEADKQDGQKLLEDYLKTPQGLTDIANETPSPTGNGKLRKHISKVPDPFSDFDIEIPELDLWLGNNRIEGKARATGEVNGFGFTANLRFRARPVLITQPSLAIEMHDLQIDDPDIDISLPPWLEWAFGFLVSAIGGPVWGAVVGFLLSSIISSLVEAFIPSNLGSQVPEQEAKKLPRLPPGVRLKELSVVPEFLAIMGEWVALIDDPRPFWAHMKIGYDVVSEPVGISRPGEAWFTCLGELGVVMDSNPQFGTRFEYTHQSWKSRVRAAIEATAVPLPLTRFPWTIAVGYRSMAQYHFPVITTSPQPLVAGQLTFTSDVWRPEPPLKGHLANQTFTIDVQRGDDDTFTLSVPPAAGCVLIQLETKVIDAAGETWNLAAQIDVANETVTFGADFDEFRQHCGGRRRNRFLVKEPSVLDKIWNPPDVYAKVVQEAIRTEQPAITSGIASLLEDVGGDAFQLILAPSQFRQRRR